MRHLSDTLRNSLPYLAILLIVGVTARLGVWQLERAALRESIETRQNALQKEPPIVLGAGLVRGDALEFHPLQAEGEWLPARMVLLDNQIYHGRAGFHVFMPLRLGDSATYVLVNRGWIAGTASRQQLPAVATPPGRVQIEGFARLKPPTFSSIAGHSRQGPVWSDLSLSEFRERAGLDVQPLILYQTSEAADGLVRDWHKPGSGAERNRGYAIQWFAMTLLAAAFGLGMLIKRYRPMRGKHDE